MYLHLPYGSVKNIPLFAPGDIHITSVIGNKDLKTGDFTIYFALCQDVYGYFVHVQTLSEEIIAMAKDVACEDWSNATDEFCTRIFQSEVSAGTIIGEVGGPNGVFDFGTYDYRTKLDYINPARFGSAEQKPRSLHIVCPLDYYDDASLFYQKIDRTEEPRCGLVMQDVLGTLQGNWYQGDASNWNNHLAFVHENDEPEQSVVSIGGVFTDSGRWLFTAKETGQVNRKFTDVAPDDNIYCYQAEIQTIPSDPLPVGRIILQLTSDTELKIEYQDAACGGSYSFTDKVVTYER